MIVENFLLTICIVGISVTGFIYGRVTSNKVKILKNGK